MNMSKYDKMVECNRRVSVEKINLARITILEMVEEGERVTVPKLMVQTGLSRGSHIHMMLRFMKFGQ